MKLTTSIRNAFVRAAMTDVPSVDYDRQAANLIQEDFVTQMPVKIRAIFRDTELRGFLRTQQVHTPGPLADPYVIGSSFKVNAETMVKLQELAANKAEQSARLNKLKSELNATALSATTRKQLVDMLPEFEKYLPADEKAANRMVPAIANLVADFAKAGWPKEKAA